MSRDSLDALRYMKSDLKTTMGVVDTMIKEFKRYNEMSKTKTTFKVGDRVKCIKPFAGETRLVGKYGTIIYIFEPLSAFECTVEFDDKFPSGHSGNNKCRGKAGHCRFGDFSELELVSAKKVIVITTDGATTTATLREGKNVIKTATTKCHPHDTFSFEEGAKVAFERLLTPEKPKYYNGKAVCVDNSSNESSFTVGKIYTFVDGRTTDNNGEKRHYFGDPCETLEEFNKRFSAKFIEVVE